MPNAQQRWRKIFRKAYPEVIYLAVNGAFGVIASVDGVSNEMRLVSLLCFFALLSNYFVVKLEGLK